MSNRAFNFYAGPATLPYDVVKTTSEAALDFQNLGLSILEISHRSKEFDNVIKTAQSDLKELMGLGDDYHVLFLQGGASLQFYMVPLNLYVDGKNAEYVNTGAWSKKAIKEAKLVGDVDVIASSEDQNFSYIPSNVKSLGDKSYLHITTNNTIFGTQFSYIPESGNVPLIGDMSSDMLSKDMDFSKFSLIYAGAQKNMGPSGATIVVIKDDLLQRAKANTPTMLNYKTHTDKDSLFNTPSTLSIFTIGQVLKWIKNKGGVSEIEKLNRKKSELLYNAFDDMNDYYKGTVKNKESRSLMNVTFNLPTPELEKKFITEATAKSMFGLKGHRSVGGVRASIYNAFPYEGVEFLVDFMKNFKKNN